MRTSKVDLTRLHRQVEKKRGVDAHTLGHAQRMQQSAHIRMQFAKVLSAVTKATLVPYMNDVRGTETSMKLNEGELSLGYETERRSASAWLRN